MISKPLEPDEITLRNSIQTLEDHINRAKSATKILETNLRQEIAEIQKTCQHRLTTYVPDPAGGYGSYYRCDICGFEW